MDYSDANCFRGTTHVSWRHSNPWRRKEVRLTAGTNLGSYEVLEAIGAGGMGEVYRARDTKLKRDVAIKILPDEFSRD